MKSTIIAATGLLAIAHAAAIPAGPKLNPGESCSPINNQPGVLGCQDGTGGTFNIVNGQRQGKRGALEDAAISAAQAATGKFPPGTPVVDGSLQLKAGESCSTTSTKGVLGCDDGTGGTFNIVNGKRQ